MNLIASGKQFFSNDIAEINRSTPVDIWLLLATLILLGLGLVMVASSSMMIAERQVGQPFYYLIRQGMFVSLGLLVGWLAFQMPLQQWKKMGPLLFLFGLLLLLMVFIPGIGFKVNGSARWINLGFVKVQASELMKLFIAVYLSGYLVRRGVEVRETLQGFIKPLGLLAMVALLLLLEPDFGATTVIGAMVMGMLFLAGVRFGKFILLLLVVVAGMALLAVSAPYRMARLTGFIDPWADPFNSGFQLTQALIAFGRGEWFGVGLGDSVQKLFYLPEAHTDFLFAVLAEELGLIGVVSVIMLFATFVYRGFFIAAEAEKKGLLFGSYLAYGITIWVGLQAFVNIGVNSGLLPTKGLTLPLMSYGGSSLVVMCVAIALLLRVDFEQRQVTRKQLKGRLR